MAKTIMSLTEFKAKAAEVLAEIEGGEQTVVITRNGRPVAIVQDFEAHQRLRDALSMLKLVLPGEADVAAGRTRPQHEVFAGLRERLASNG